MSSTKNTLPDATTVIPIEAVSTNTAQQVITVTEDKIKLILDKYERELKSRGNILTPLSIIFTLIVTFVTTEFKDRFGLSADQIKSVFIVIFIIALFYLYAVSILFIQLDPIGLSMI